MRKKTEILESGIQINSKRILNNICGVIESCLQADQEVRPQFLQIFKQIINNQNV